MFDKKLALKIFEAFSIERWNDLIRPFEIVEMDKTAEKAVLAYLIGKLEEKKGFSIDWNYIIYGIFFDLLKKIALCDIKSPVQRMIRDEYPEEYIKLNNWVIDQYKPILQDQDLLNEFIQYIQTPPDSTNKTWRVLRAAHKYSTMREVEMLRKVNENFRLFTIEQGINKDIQEFLDVYGLQQLVLKQKPYDFLMEIEKLRFQTRWNQTPRVPRTSVLGHSYYVAVLTLLMSRSLKLSQDRIYNNFFSALFHDLPEAVTRDIISPVKQATDHLPQIVKQIEDRIVKRELIPLMDVAYREELLFFTGNEFDNRRRAKDGSTQLVSFEDLQKTLDSRDKPTDGKLVRACDHIAAFIEADSSINHGITSRHLVDGRNNILSLYPQSLLVNNISVYDFLIQF